MALEEYFHPFFGIISEMGILYFSGDIWHVIID